MTYPFKQNFCLERKPGRVVIITRTLHQIEQLMGTQMDTGEVNLACIQVRFDIIEITCMGLYVCLKSLLKYGLYLILYIIMN